MSSQATGARDGVAPGRPPGPPPLPRATYRLQFHEGFGFDDATALVPYLGRLGISHVYASPFLAARAGSTHGYDIVDHNRFNPEVGDAAAFERMVAALHAHGMGLILDFVPNHMGIGSADNPWWLDVLEWGQSSPYAGFFDINWSPSVEHLRGKVLLPVLGDHYGNVLERGEIVLRFDREQGSFSAWYHEHRFPIAIRDYPRILRAVQSEADGTGAALAPHVAGFSRLAAKPRGARQAAMLRREADALRYGLAALAKADPDIAAAIDRVVDRMDGTPGDPASFRELHALLERQAYHIAYWRVASNDINYRRFFDINDLAGLAIEDPELFEISHRLVFQLIAEGKLQGVRLDHIDGLYDPAAYCRRLQDRAAYLVPPREPSPDGTQAQPRHPIYLLVEKILAPHEHLRTEWPVDGTTGYEFMNLINGLFVDPAALEPLTETYQRFLGRSIDFHEMVVEAKRQILRNNLSSELNVLVDMAYRIARQSLTTRDYTRQALRDALIELISHFPVYRTYVTADGVDERDRHYLNWAMTHARRDSTADDLSIFDFVGALVATDLKREPGRPYRRAEVLHTAMKFQQLTGPVMAKAFEDTALYRFNRLVSLNEVGGEPERFGVSAAAFHYLNAERLKNHPFSMLATATHDHKRGEDVRARIDVLSEMPEAWSRAVRRWHRINRLKVREIDGRPAPGRNDEYLLYQTLVGAWPLHAAEMAALPDRIVAYMIKAVREAKARSNWTAPKADYEDAVEAFVRAILDPERSATFLADFVAFHAGIAAAGAVNGLAQTLLKLTVPGVPDTYQGCEFWDLSMVDPDNRRPVDYAARAAGLDAEDGVTDPAALVADWTDGRVKQHVVAATLRFRQRAPELFALGDYAGVEAAGPRAGHVVALQRRLPDGAALVAVAPRLAAGILAGDGTPRLDPSALEGTRLVLGPAMAGRTLRDVMTGRTIEADGSGDLDVAALLAPLPVALLELTPGA
ncbi:MAG: malto-oligosyltrehalose synthase [Alphaproteobacteria bacterium]